VDGEKLAEFNYGLSLVFTKAGWFTGAAPVFSEAREESCDLKMFLSQGKRLVARKSLPTVSPVAARLYAFPHSSPVGRRWRLAVGLNGAIFLFLYSKNIFRGPMKALSKVCILWLLWGRRQMTSTWFCRAKVITSMFLVCEYFPPSTKITGSCYFGFVGSLKWRNHWVKISLCIHQGCGLSTQKLRLRLLDF
jgi:hypothetical protein